MKEKQSGMGRTVLTMTGIVLAIATGFVIATNQTTESRMSEQPVQSPTASPKNTDLDLNATLPSADQYSTLEKELPAKQEPRDVGREVPLEITATEAHGFAPGRISSLRSAPSPPAEQDRENVHSTDNIAKITTTRGTIQDQAPLSPETSSPAELRAIPSAPFKAR